MGFGRGGHTFRRRFRFAATSEARWMPDSDQPADRHLTLRPRSRSMGWFLDVRTVAIQPQRSGRAGAEAGPSRGSEPRAGHAWCPCRGRTPGGRPGRSCRSQQERCPIGRRCPRSGATAMRQSYRLGRLRAWPRSAPGTDSGLWPTPLPLRSSVTNSTPTQHSGTMPPSAGGRHIARNLGD